MTNPKKGKLQASIVLEFYENATEARITKGFEYLNPGKIQRALSQMFAAYAYKRREVLRQYRQHEAEQLRRQQEMGQQLEEETSDGARA